METLLQTKLFSPTPRAAAVDRPRLAALIANGANGALTLVSAPAGFGKTTLLAAWAAQAALPVGWLSLDEEDNDTQRFLGYLAAAADKALPGAGETACQLLGSPNPPPAQAVVKALVNALSDPPRPLALALDDYHFIRSAEVHAVVTYLLDHLPPTAHVLISTRSDPPFPLARLRARGELAELRADDLAFTEAEAADFLSGVMGLSLSAEDIATLESRTEGWIAGLQMAAISMQGRRDLHAFIQAFSGSHRYVLDYLAEEALNRQPADVQQFLLTTSILDRLTAPLCSALTGMGDSAAQALLEYLERANLFVVALDDERRWFRYHHLFADLLRTRLGQAQPAAPAALHGRASLWMEANGEAGGLYVEAVQHAFAAADPARAAALIERYGPPRYSSSDHSVLLLMENLPPEWLLERPKLGVYQAWLWCAAGRIQEALPLLGRLQKHLSALAPTDETRWMRCIVNLMTAFTGIEGEPTAPALPGDIAALDRMSAADQGLRAAADLATAMLLSRRGDYDAAASVLTESARRDAALGGNTAAPIAIPFLARIRLGQGKLHAAAGLCREYLHQNDPAGVRRVYSGGSLNIVLGEVLREWDQLAEAEVQIRSGIHANEPWDNLTADMVGYAALARVQQAQGRLEDAFGTLQRLETFLEGRTLLPDQQQELRSLRVRLLLERGDLTQAAALADEIRLREPPDWRQELDRLTLARVRAAQRRFADALATLEGAAEMARNRQWTTRLIKIDLLRAVALAGLGRTDDALDTLGECLALAEPEGHVRTFLDGGETVRELLGAYVRRPGRQPGAYERSLLRAFAAGSGAQAGMDSLTPRERDVLRLMAEGRSNREIAASLFLSEGTVKFHVHSILEKMGVPSRAQAVAMVRGKGRVA